MWTEKVYREFLRDINKEIDRLNYIINDLLMLTKMDSETSVLNIDTILLSELVGKAAHSMIPIAEANGITLGIKLTEEMEAQCDAIKIRRAIVNLVDNAIKYSKEGDTVTVTLMRNGSNAEIEVKDTGIGIPKKDLPNIFDRFYRVDKARARDTGGTGLGLYITHRIVQLHSGTIRVQSKEGKGSVFTLAFPLVAPKRNDS